MKEEKGVYKNKEQLLFIAKTTENNKNRIIKLDKKIDELINRIHSKIDAQNIEKIKNKHNLK